MLFELLRDAFRNRRSTAADGLRDRRTTQDAIAEIVPHPRLMDSPAIERGGLQALADIVLPCSEDLNFSILEIGAVPLDSRPEPFYPLVDLFPGSKIFAFEVDETLCATLNQRAHPAVRYFPFALGGREERRTFYETQHPMCCSLYEPNEPLLRLYNSLEVAYPRCTSTIETVSLDYFSRHNDVGSVDFIKIDIQGAELDVFQGGKSVLQDVVALICEVEFIPLYVNQPLFGDVSAWLSNNGFMFHKFLGLAGRALAPIVIGGNPNLPSQVMWSDAMFVTDISALSRLTAAKLLKLAIFAYIYGSPDLTYHCLEHFDRRSGTDIAQRFLQHHAQARHSGK